MELESPLLVLCIPVATRTECKGQSHGVRIVCHSILRVDLVYVMSLI